MLKPFDRVRNLAGRDAGVKAADVTMVLRTGGSSRVPAFVRVLEDRSGPDLVRERDAFATVTHGLGVHALNLWGT